MFINFNSGFAPTKLTNVTIITEITVKVIALATALRRPLSSFAPNLCDTNTANPLVNPVANPLTKNTIDPVDPTAAKASTPTNLPTIIVSTIL